MESAIHPLVLGALMVIVTSAWFAAMSWAGMREDDTALVPVPSGAVRPWWMHDSFTGQRPEHTLDG